MQYCIAYISVLGFMLVCFELLQITEPEWAPDFGPAKFVPSWGATVTGARKFLIAYNVNLIATKQQAHRIALNIREGGRGPNEVSYDISMIPYSSTSGHKLANGQNLIHLSY